MAIIVAEAKNEVPCRSVERVCASKIRGWRVTICTIQSRRYWPISRETDGCRPGCSIRQPITSHAVTSSETAA